MLRIIRSTVCTKGGPALQEGQRGITSDVDAPLKNHQLPSSCESPPPSYNRVVTIDPDSISPTVHTKADVEIDTLLSPLKPLSVAYSVVKYFFRYIYFL